jgi:hypothetical protein
MVNKVPVDKTNVDYIKSFLNKTERGLPDFLTPKPMAIEGFRLISKTFNPAVSPKEATKIRKYDSSCTRRFTENYVLHALANSEISLDQFIAAHVTFGIPNLSAAKQRLFQKGSSHRANMLEEEIALSDGTLVFDEKKQTVSMLKITPSVEENITNLSGALMLNGIPRTLQLPRRSYQILSAQSILSELPTLWNKAFPYIKDLSFPTDRGTKTGQDILMDASRDYNAIGYIRIVNTTPPLVVHNSIGQDLLNKGLKPLTETCEEHGLSFDFISVILDNVYRNPGVKETLLAIKLEVPYPILKNAINILSSVGLITCISTSNVDRSLFHPTVVRNQHIQDCLMGQISTISEHEALQVLKYLLETESASIEQMSKDLDENVRHILHKVDALQSVLLVNLDTPTTAKSLGQVSIIDGKQDAAAKISSVVSEHIRAEIPDDEIKKGLKQITAGKHGKTSLDKVVDKTLQTYFDTESE